MKINKLHLCLALQLLAIVAEANILVPANKFENVIDSEQEKGLPEILRYSNYLQRFKRAYNPLEAARKAKLFIGRTLQIFQHNTQYADKKTNYYLSQNEFTDLTPEELTEKLHIGEGDELESVVEASQYPDVPADSLLSVRQFNKINDEGFSRSSLDMIQSSHGDHSGGLKSQANFKLDFKTKLDDETLLAAIKQVNDLPKRYSKKFEELVDIKYEKNSIDETATKKENGVVHKTIVESNNKNYNPPITTSYGIWEEFEITPEHYKKYGLNDIVDDLNMTPYPTPEIPTRKVLADEEGEGLLSSLLNSLREICNSIDDLDGLLDDEWVHITNPAEDKKVITYDIDWRDTGCISRVKAQRSCNSCYAFAVIGLMEYFYCRQTKNLTDFSEQYVIDCGVKNELRGCKGGKITNVGRFIRKFGLELNAMYPYNGYENQCPIEDDRDDEKKTGYLRPQITKWQKFSEITAWYKWILKSPLIVGVNMPADFLAYGGGVHDGSNCEIGKTHAMLLVGSGREDDKEFWLLKNSYSDLWGENGYFRLSKSAPVRCFNSAIVVRASFIDNKSP